MFLFFINYIKGIKTYRCKSKTIVYRNYLNSMKKLVTFQLAFLFLVLIVPFTYSSTIQIVNVKEDTSSKAQTNIDYDLDKKQTQQIEMLVKILSKLLKSSQRTKPAINVQNANDQKYLIKTLGQQKVRGKTCHQQNKDNREKKEFKCDKKLEEFAFKDQAKNSFNSQKKREENSGESNELQSKKDNKLYHSHININSLLKQVKIHEKLANQEKQRQRQQSSSEEEKINYERKLKQNKQSNKNKKISPSKHKISIDKNQTQKNIINQSIQSFNIPTQTYSSRLPLNLQNYSLQTSPPTIQPLVFKTSYHMNASPSLNQNNPLIINKISKQLQTNPLPSSPLIFNPQNQPLKLKQTSTDSILPAQITSSEVLPASFLPLPKIAAPIKKISTISAHKLPLVTHKALTADQSSMAPNSKASFKTTQNNQSTAYLLLQDRQSTSQNQSVSLSTNKNNQSVSHKQSSTNLVNIQGIPQTTQSTPKINKPNLSNSL